MEKRWIYKDGIFVFHLRDSFALHFCANGVVWAMRSQLAFVTFAASARCLGFLYLPHQYWPLIQPLRYIQTLHVCDPEATCILAAPGLGNQELPSMLW